MRIALDRKKYQTVKRLGRMNMTFGSIAFYQLMEVCQTLMHTDKPQFSKKPNLSLGDQIGYYMQNAPMPSALNVFVPPEIKHPGFSVETSLFQDDVMQNESIDDNKIGPPLEEEEEEYDDIDALLSTEYEENEEDEDDEVVSTARTGACYECSSPDSCSNYYETVSKKRRKVSEKGKSSGTRGNEKKCKRIRKMVRALRGIVPGANRMSALAVLDESVRYLKSLKGEVQKL
ncbi:hypothetical protein OROGR_012692 [Orobanche gracilis]